VEFVHARSNYKDSGALDLKKLLVLLSEYSRPQKNVLAATLAWIAKEAGLLFEIYYEAYHSGKHFSPTSIEDYFGSTVTSGFHHERFYFLNAHFDVEYVIYGDPKIFSSFLKGSNASIIAKAENLIKLYREVFSHYDLPIPKEAAIVETVPLHGKDVIRPSTQSMSGFHKQLLLRLYRKVFSYDKAQSFPNLIEISPYCYPEIFYRRALGIGTTFPETNLPDFCRTIGVKKVYSLFLANQKVEELKSQGFDVEVVDNFQQTDNYWSVTSRIARRWLNHCDGLAYCDPVLASYWLPWLCRHNRLAVYEVFMESVRNQLRDLVLTTENKILCGRHSHDRDITELSRDDITFQIIDPSGPSFPVVEESDYRMCQSAKSYYEFEPDDSTLESLADDRKILCTILFYCPDIRHVDGLPSILELATLTNMKVGLGITAQWYKLVPEILEMINVPIENGGAFPNVEPLLCSTGMGVGVEAEGFLRRETLRRHMNDARQIISKVAGAKSLPKGHYPFLDTIKDYPYSESVFGRANKFDPSFEAVKEAGFEYSISYASPGKPKVVHRSESFIAINHTNKHWFPYSPFNVMSNLFEIKRIEIGLTLKKKPGWIIVALDTPFWLFPYYRWEKSSKLFNFASYILRCGLTGNLTNTTPHVISRYARILDEKGFI